MSEKNGFRWLPTEASIEGLCIPPNVRDQNSLIPAAETFFDRPHQAGSDAVMLLSGVHNQFAQVSPESKIMGADETKNLTVVFPHKCQSTRESYCIGNGLIGPPGLPESWDCLHQGSNAWNIRRDRLANHAS